MNVWVFLLIVFYLTVGTTTVSMMILESNDKPSFLVILGVIFLWPIIFIRVILEK